MRAARRGGYIRQSRKDTSSNGLKPIIARSRLLRSLCSLSFSFSLLSEAYSLTSLFHCAICTFVFVARFCSHAAMPRERERYRAEFMQRLMRQRTWPVRVSRARSGGRASHKKHNLANEIRKVPKGEVSSCRLALLARTPIGDR